MHKKNISFVLSALIVMFSTLIVFGQTENTLITKYSVGEIKLGMTLGEARKVLPKGFKLAPTPGDENSWLVGVFEGEKLLLTIGYYEGDAEYDQNGKVKLPPINENQKIESIGIEDSRFQTAEGVRIGTTIAEAEKKYGKLKEMFNFPHGGETGKFVNQPEFLSFGFRVKVNEDKEIYTAGIYEPVPDCPEDAYPPTCSKATKYNPGSYISAMSLIAPKPVQKIITVKDTPVGYEVRIFGPLNCEESSETTYQLARKVPIMDGYEIRPQFFEFKELYPCGDLGYEPDETTVTYKDQSDVFFGDYNFDGNLDLALRVGMNGGYGFPSYQIYLFSKEKDEFVLSPSFTKLGQYQGMFEVNENRKMIFNHSKDGCCFYQTEGYKIVNNEPFKVYEYTVDGSPPNNIGDPKVTTKKLINGKWRTWDKNSAARVSFDKGKTSKIISVDLSKNEPIKWLKVGASKGQIMKVTVDSAKADVKLVDFKGDVRSYESYERLKEDMDFPVNLIGNGDYFLEVSAEENININLTITIE